MYLENLIAKGNTANIYLDGDKVIKVFNNDLSEDVLICFIQYNQSN